MWMDAERRAYTNTMMYMMFSSNLFAFCVSSYTNYVVNYWSVCNFWIPSRHARVACAQQLRDPITDTNLNLLLLSPFFSLTLSFSHIHTLSLSLSLSFYIFCGRANFLTNIRSLFWSLPAALRISRSSFSAHIAIFEMDKNDRRQNSQFYDFLIRRIYV